MLQSRVLLSLVLAGMVAGAPLSALAQASADAAAVAVQASTAPLPAAGAAGVKQAQGFGFDDIPWVFVVGGSLVLTAVILGLTDDDAATAATTATN